MIKFTEAQKDALIEICNVGVSKAAKQLSLLLNSRINISVPHINLLKSNQIKNVEAFNNQYILSSVYQTLSGDISGRVALIFHRDQARLLTHFVIGKTPKLSEEEIRACEQEAMLEIGNIIVTTCVTAIANMLSMKIKLTVPNYVENKIQNIIKEHMSAFEKISDDIFLISTQLETEKENILGNLLLILSVDSINSLFDNLKKLIKVG